MPPKSGDKNENHNIHVYFFCDLCTEVRASGALSLTSKTVWRHQAKTGKEHMKKALLMMTVYMKLIFSILSVTNFYFKLCTFHLF